MKHKKVLISAYIVILAIVIALMLNKIFAAGSTSQDISVNYALYEVTNNGTEIIESRYHNLTEEEKAGKVYKDDLDSYWYVFCIEHSYPLVYRREETGIYDQGDNLPCRPGETYIGVDGNTYGFTFKSDSTPVASFSGTPSEGELVYTNDKIDKDKAYYSRRIVVDDNTSMEEKDDLTAAERFILATVPKNSGYETDAQKAIWAIKNNEDCDNEIYKKSQAFQQYWDGRNDPAVTVNENYNDNKYTFKYEYDGKEGYFIAGPINISYGNLKQSYDGVDLTVRTIENIKLIGTDLKGKSVEITNNFELVKKDGTPWKINDAGLPPNYDNKNAQNTYNFPETGQDFYIKIKADVYNSYSSIDSFKVTFKMLNADAKVYEIRGVGIEYSEWKANEVKHSSYPDNYSGNDRYELLTDNCSYTTWESNTRFKGCYNVCTDSHWAYGGGHFLNCVRSATHDRTYADLRELKCTAVYAGKRSNQPLWILEYGRLYWDVYDLDIEFEPPKGTPTPSTGTPTPGSDTPTPPTFPITPTPTPKNPTYIDIGGNVWVDMPADSKTGGDNAISGDSYDFARPNVKVQLFFSDGTPDGTPVKAGVNGVIDKDNIFNGGEYITYTDSNGNYKFYYLPVENDYFVRFIYDGVTYEAVDAFVGGSEASYPLYANRNKSVYDNNSKAKEDLNERNIFNRSFFVVSGEDIYGNNYKMGEHASERSYGSTVMRSKYSLEYWSKRFDEFPESRLLTTDNNGDVTTLRDTGKAKEQYGMRADTVYTYPFRDNGKVIIRDQDNKYQLGYLDHVNLGLKLRRTADLALRVQVKAGATTIKDKEKVVGYGLRSDKIVDGTQLEEEWVKQEISVSDYFWKDKYTAIYGEEGSAIQGMLLDEFADQLNVYVLYKIDIENQCEDSDEYGRITELVDYFDTRLCLITDPTELSKVRKLFGSLTTVGGNDSQFSWIVSSGAGVTWHSEPKENGNNKTYNEIKTDGLDLTVKEETESIYLILKVANREDNANLLYTGTDSDTDGLENITEISKYTIYNGNNIAGKVDKDSAPENAIPGDKETYEDDTDAAPMFRLEINWVPKEIKGNVWDDLNEDGINNSENPVKDVTVKLVEYIETADGIIEVERPGLYIDEGKSEIGTREAPIKTDENGNYSFYVEGGNYRLKFIYGDTEMLLSNKKYNGQDYQATAYTPIHSYNELACETEEGLAGITDRLSMDDRDYSYKKAQEDYENENWLKSRDESAARDDANIRSDTIKNASIITYENGSLLRNLSADKTVDEAIATTLSGGNKVEHKSVYQNSDENPNYTYMEALTDIFAISSNDLADYQIVNFGLKERPTADMSLDKTVERIVLKTSDGTTLIDTADASKLKNMQKLGELGNELDSTFINMDAVAMDGATLDIDYKIAINYNGEEDKLQNYVYVESDEAIINELVNELRTKLNMPELTRTDNILTRSDVFDYVSINLEFRKDDNSTQDWTKVYDEDDKNVTTVKDEVTANGVEGITIYNSSDTNEYIKYNTITKNIVDEVLPRNAKIVSKVLRTESENLNSDTREDPIPLHLGITLSENTTKNDVNDFDFSNSAEIVTIYTSAGRRQYVDNDATTEEEKLGTIPGNYTPYDRTEENNVEHDGDTTGITSVTPPLGDQKIYYVIAIVSATIIIVGIVLIKKKVLKK